MATRLKPSRINVDNTPRVGDGAAYQNDNDFHWSMGGGDMSYEDFEWHTLTGTSLVIEDISNNITPSSNFTVSAGTVKPGIEYVLRVNTGNTAYTMTLGTGVTNPNGYSTELTPNKVNQFKFIATSNSQLELEGVDTSEYLTGLTILSYGNSTWNDFITAYNKNSIVYCRASSNSNPATGTQGRLAFMAYVNNATSPTEVEFQYYRSRSSHGSDANQQDEVYVYKLTNASGGTWTVEVRDTAAKIATGTGLTKAYTTSGSKSTLTIANDGVLTVNGANGTVTVNDIKQSATAPANPTAGTAWYDTTNGALKVYNGSAWETIATGGSISDTAYGSGWDGQTTTAPSQNAVYDKISSIDALIPSEATSSNKLADKNYVDEHDTVVSSTTPSSPTEGMLWYDTTNDQLKVYDGTNWNVTGKEYNAGKGIEIGTVQDYSAMRGPCPEGFHVPTKTEMQSLIDTGVSLSAWSTGNTNMSIYLKLPPTGYRSGSSPSGAVSSITTGYYQTCTKATSSNNYYLTFYSTTSIAHSGKTSANAIRPFKDSPVVPDSNWTTIYSGTGDAGIFHNAILGLISISSDGINWITIADKNLGATVVWNSGDETSQSNKGGFYQWGNNYMFPATGSITTSSTKVDANNYGPGNYYSSSTFIYGGGDWSSVTNNNLRGGVTGVVTINNAITNTGVLSVNGQTGDVTIESGSNVRVFTVVPRIINGTTVSQSQQDFNTLMEMGRWIAEGFSYPNNETNRVAILRGSMSHGLFGMEFVSIVNVKTTPYYVDDNQWDCPALSITYSGNRGGDTSYAVDFSINSSSTSIVFDSTPYGYFTPGTGTTGQVLTKTSSGYNWQAPTGGLQVAPNSPITGIKYVWYGTEAQYANLSQYYTDTPGDTEFHCF